MAEYETIAVSRDGPVATVSLNRPDVRNAMNPVMISEITAVFTAFNTDDDVRVIILRGEGNVFCAGGDLNWMKDVLGQTEAEVVEDSRLLLNMYRSINDSPKLVIASLRGAAVAGGLGIISCADVVIAEAQTKFCISEVKIGLVPGIIAAFILPRMGPGWFRYLSKTAILFDTDTARTAGLIHEIANDDAAWMPVLPTTPNAPWKRPPMRSRIPESSSPRSAMKSLKKHSILDCYSTQKPDFLMPHRKVFQPFSRSGLQPGDRITDPVRSCSTRRHMARVFRPDRPTARKSYLPLLLREQARKPPR